MLPEELPDSGLVAGLALALTAVGCTGGVVSAPSVVRADSGGVEVVSITGELPVLPRTFEERFVLGGASEGPESFFQLSNALVDVDPDGFIYVLDPMNHRIVRFSPDGEVAGAVGRRGEGPGEFGQPFALAVGEGGVLVVADRARNSLLRLTPEGEALPSLPVQAPIYGAAEVAVVGSTPVFRWWQWTGRNSGFAQLIWGGEDLRVVAQVENSGDEGDRSFPSCPEGFPGGKYLDPGLVWTTSRAGAAVTPTHGYEIRVFSPEGELVRIIRRDVERESVTVADLQGHLEDPFMANTGRGPQALCPVPLDEAIHIKGHLEHLPAITALALSDEGEVWARRGALPFEAGVIDVYDPTGRPLGTLPSDTPFPLTFTPDGIVSVREDEIGVSRLVAWRRR
jgi:hypothetical protein